MDGIEIWLGAGINKHADGLHGVWGGRERELRLACRFLVERFEACRFLVE